MTKIYTIGQSDANNMVNTISNENMDNQNIDSEEISSPNFADVQTTYVNNEKNEEYTWVDNTGKTGEDIKNPIANKLDKNDRRVSGNPLACLLVFLEVLLKPGSGVIKSTEKYVEGKRTLKVYITMSIYLLIFSIAGRIVSSCFVEKFVAAKRDYAYVLDFSNLGQVNFVSVILYSIAFTIGISLIMTTINYLSSFFGSKGLSFGAYLLINILSLIPFALGVNVVFPIVKIISKNIAVILLIISFILYLLTYLNAMDYCMEFSNFNRKILYLLINFIVVIIVIYLLIALFFEADLNNFLDLIT